MDDNTAKLELIRLNGIWSDIVEIFQNKVLDYPHYLMTPKEFIEFLTLEMRYDRTDIITIFSIICMVKKGDGRFYSDNRNFLEQNMSHDLRSFLLGMDERKRYEILIKNIHHLDDIHSSCLNQTISELRRVA